MWAPTSASRAISAVAKLLVYEFTRVVMDYDDHGVAEVILSDGVLFLKLVKSRTSN